MYHSIAWWNFKYLFLNIQIWTCFVATLNTFDHIFRFTFVFWNCYSNICIYVDFSDVIGNTVNLAAGLFVLALFEIIICILTEKPSLSFIWSLTTIKPPSSTYIYCLRWQGHWNIDVCLAEYVKIDIDIAITVSHPACSATFTESSARAFSVQLILTAQTTVRLLNVQYTQMWIHTLTGHFIWCTLLIPDWNLFSLQNRLNSSFRGTDSTLETFLRDSGPYWHNGMVAGDLSVAHPWCVSAAPPHPKGALLDWDLLTVEVIGVQWTHCNV